MSCSCHTHDHDHAHEKHEENEESKRKEKILLYINIARIVIASILTGLSFIDFSNTWTALTLVIIAYVIIGYDTFFNMIIGFSKKRFFDENFLMLIATIGAFIVGEYPEASLVLILYHIGEMLEEYATNKANRSIGKLIDDLPLYAHKIVDGQVIEAKPEDIKVGDILEVRPGEKVALDGTILSGNVSLNQSSLTGESLPVELGIGDEVYSGSINLQHSFTMKVTKVFADSTLSTIMKLIASEEGKKSKQEKFMTRFSKIYTPIVCLISVGLFVLLYGLNGFKDYQEPLYNALNILIISCPCSLVISIPLTFFMGIGRASRLGVLIKGGLAIEKIGKANTFCFDKTGTISEGNFTIRNIEEIEVNSLLIAASLENNISHPIAKAYLNAIHEKELSPLNVTMFTNIPGIGIKGVIDGKTYQLGSNKILSENNIEIDETDTPYLVNYLISDGKCLATFILADKIKETSKEAINSLNADPTVRSTVMISGDVSKIAEEVGKQTGIKEVYSSLLPEQKVSVIRTLKEEKGSVVAYVGDGINDSPSLMAADIGIAMGGLGSEAAIESSDIVIMNDDLNKINVTRRIGKKVITLITENLVFILLFKLAIIILAAFNYSNMILSIIGDVGVMVVAILNSLRILLVKPKAPKTNSENPELLKKAD